MRRYRIRALTTFLAAVMGAALMVGPSIAASFQNRTPSGQGWFWDRPTTQVEGVGDPFAQNVNNIFAGDHLYVGWDAADPDADKREMIAGVAFDLFIAGVPSGSTITEFKVRLLEHTTGSQHNNVNPGQANVMGIIACPWGDFFAGNAADPLSAAPKGGGECGAQSVSGVRSTNPVNPNALAANQMWAWDFDLTDMMSELWSNDQMTAFSLEPNKFADDSKKGQSWTISFHSGAYTEPQGADPNGPQEPKPGVLAQISWAPPPENIGGGGGDDFGSIDFGSDVGDTGGEFEFNQGPPPDAPVEQTEAAPAQLFQGAAEGPSAPFWSIGFGRWLMAALLGIAIAAAGWMLTSEPVSEGRQPGAINALINGRGTRSGQ